MKESSPAEMWDRVSDFFGRDSREQQAFYRALKDFKFVPAGRILSGAGADQHSATFYNCFVIGIKGTDPSKGRDSRHAIMHTLSHAVEILSRGGGVGINWSILRPSGSYIRGVHGTSSGPCSWMKGMDSLADQIRQGGSRTAALMFLMEDWHPDILEFIESPHGHFSRANFSVGVSDRFMDTLANDGDWVLEFPDTSDYHYDSVWEGDLQAWKAAGLPTIVHRTVRARDLWAKMCDRAWSIGSPGLVFLERANKRLNTQYCERVIGTNPCGEQALPAGGACNLGSINLVAFWNPEERALDTLALRETIFTAVRFLDAVIDHDVDVSDETGVLQKNVRRVGLGTMGLADVLLLAGIRYGSDECVDFIRQTYSFIRNCAYEASVSLAREFGKAPYFSREYLDSPFIRDLPQGLKTLIGRHGIRNLSLLTQAPTGTIAILAGVSSGIEPVFSRDYVRKDGTGEFRVTHPLFEGEGDHLVTAHDLSIQDHLRVMAEIQKYVDSSISKTVNLPYCCSTDAVDEAYRLAYALGCKGVTVYRQGSLEDILGTGGECATCSI